jgi:phenylacetate-CoA ligase
MSLMQSLYYGMPVLAQNALVSGYGYYLQHKRQGRGVDDVRALIAKSRTWSRQEVVAYQTRELSAMLRLCAAAVPYYRDLWSKVAIDPESLRGVADLAKLPILPKDTVRRQREQLLRPGVRPYWTQHTSGSTGTPVVVHVNERTYKLVHALLESHEEDCGVGRQDLRATFAGRMVQRAEDSSPPFWRYNRAQRQLLFSAYHMSDRTLPYYVEELARRQPVELIGYPSAIALLAGHITGSGKRGVVKPRAVVTNSETLFAWQRESIEEAFCCPVRDYYGSAEALVFAAQCAAGTYHLDPLLGIAEIVDSDGQPAAPGEPGRIVCTTLTNDVMPLVRYEVGDTAVRLDGPCPCGSALEGIREIIGRQDDVVKTPDGRIVGRLDHIFKGVTGIQECQIVQEALDCIRLLLVAEESFDDRQEGILRANARGRLGAAVRIELERVRQIPRTRAGKFRGVISRVAPDIHPVNGVGEP